MIARAKESRTADLFAAAPALSPSRAATVPRAPATPQVPVRARNRPLWYAAVFPQLPTTEPSTECLCRLARHAQRFTSFVSLEPPAALLLEIRGSLRLFGTAAALQARIDAGWADIGVPVQSAAAPSPLAALWFARSGGRTPIEDPAALAGCLAQLPIACTAWEPQRLARLRAIGVTRLGDLLRLPRAGLARRFGTGILTDLDAALARAPAPRRAFVPRERFHERCDFDAEIDRVATLVRALEPLVGRCARFLRERQAGVQRLQLCLRHRAAPATRLTLGFADVTGDPRRLREVLAERLSRLELAAPVRAALLRSAALAPLPAGSLDAFGGAAGRDGAAQLIERLRARFGENAVYGVSAVAEHRPEAASRRVHELRAGHAPAAAGGGAGEGVSRPVWLLPEPAFLAPRAAPAGDWRLEHGPERIESGWWDGAGIARDYYIARRTQGARLWVFQERRSGHWYLHGVFA
ncbi:MAG TPA: DNA polymerase Y family protein [Steroidobacteraceae bacterium]|nr:DNA polymerase Y family protein [Steroidobacteraceae bacterium]